MLILVRHGRTDANASGLLLGRLDPDLDEVGRGQAAAVAASLAGTRVSAVITSPLARTRATAQQIAQVTGAPVEVDERWIELDYGEFDGQPLGDIPSEVWARWRSDAAFTPPGGESLVALGERVRAGLDELTARATHEHIVVVSHVSPIKAAVVWALGVTDDITWRMFLAPASITRIAVSERGPSLHGFNDIAHL
jgi:probable phosphoglycerate mutase